MPLLCTFDVFPIVFHVAVSFGCEQAASEMSGTRKFVSPGGLPVLVGKNNRGNEHLTHNVAANTDLWFDSYRSCVFRLIIVWNS